MDKSTQRRQHRQASRVQRHRRQLVEKPDLCFTKLLPKEQIKAALAQHSLCFRERLYTPFVTLWTFLYQVLSPDQSCRAAVARLLALLCLGGQDSASARTGSYCKARQRLPEDLLADLARHSGHDLHRQVPSTRLLNGRPIKIADGTTVSMPDTPDNQKAYPQQAGQKKGLGFPIIRLVGLISLSCGAVLDVAVAFRTRWHAELDLRSIKQVMQMDVLRYKSLAMVRKEIWMHLLAYNLIRTLMARAALAVGLGVRGISFKGTLQTLVVFAMVGWSCPRRKSELYTAVLRAVVVHRVNDRPDRIEPRAVKRRPKKMIYLNEPRTLAIVRLLRGA